MSLHLSEHDEQCLVFEWAMLNEKRWPELALMFAVPNGEYRPISVAKRLKKEGIKSGVPDIYLDVPRGGYHGLRVEMKKVGGRPTKEQKAWLAALNRVGYKAVVCVGFEAARDVIEDYLSLS